MANVFTIPRSNPLRFVRTDNYKSDLPNYDNRLMFDENFGNYDDIHYQYQLFSIGDPILTQFTTNYESITINLRDENGDIIHSYVPDTVLVYDDDSGNKVFNFTITTTELSGVYLVEILGIDPARPTIEFTSEWFEIGDFDLLPLLEWKGSEYDGILYEGDEIFGFRIPASISDRKPESENTTFEGYNNELIIQKAVAKRIMNLEVDPSPWYIIEKIALALDHLNVYINKVQYTAKSGIKSEWKTRTNLFQLSCELQENGYENYLLLSEQEIIAPITGNVVWSFTGSDIISFTESDKLEISEIF